MSRTFRLEVRSAGPPHPLLGGVPGGPAQSGVTSLAIEAPDGRISAEDPSYRR
jgi:hypothetical protein